MNMCCARVSIVQMSYDNWLDFITEFGELVLVSSVFQFWWFLSVAPQNHK